MLPQAISPTGFEFPLALIPSIRIVGIAWLYAGASGFEAVDRADPMPTRSLQPIGAHAAVQRLRGGAFTTPIAIRSDAGRETTSSARLGDARGRGRA